MNVCYVYVLCSRNNRHLSVHVTPDLKHGVRQQRARIARRLGRKRVMQKLVHVERREGLSAAHARANQLRDWPEGRLRKLVTQRNGLWKSVSIRAYLERSARAWAFRQSSAALKQ